MNDLLDGPLSPAVLNAFITELEAALSPALAEDPNNMMGGADPAAVANHFNSIRQWVIDREANVRGQVGTLPAPPFFSRPGGAIEPGFPADALPRQRGRDPLLHDRRQGPPGYRRRAQPESPTAGRSSLTARAT
jgi:hypothetical protein